jgi:predicted transcriptional regulator
MDYNEIESLYLMTQCDHFILSPSTFSWWGAYLGEKQNSKVYSPDWWFDDGRDYGDLNLPHWNIAKTKL